MNGVGEVYSALAGRIEQVRAGWYDGYLPDEDFDAWEGMAMESDSEDWEW